jgi:hypothetical protein
MVGFLEYSTIKGPSYSILVISDSDGMLFRIAATMF